MSVRWGIASTGGIARAFARDLGFVTDARLVAVGSRTRASAEHFGAEFGLPHVHGSVEALAADPEVDVVYVAGIHPVHREHAVAMMESGKHVLVEKPLAMNVGEVDDIIETSRRTGRFLMEAMWMRFNPLHIEVTRRLDAGDFGAVQSIRSDFSFRVPFDPGHRLFDPVKGGGALLDVGIYPLSLACWVMGPPADIEVSGRRGETGVDVEVSLDLTWPNGARGMLSCGIDRAGSMETLIRCEEADIFLPAPSHATSNAEIRRPGSNEIVEMVSCAPASLHHQVFAVHACIRDGVRESPRMPHAESRLVAGLMDDILRRIG